MHVYLQPYTHHYLDLIMSSTRFRGQLTNANRTKTVKVNLDIIEYQEDGSYIAFSPALDLVGYGSTIKEARESWQTVLEEYFRYTLNKKTLQKDLINRGWKMAKKTSHFTPPSFSWIVQNHKEVKDIYDNHAFRKRSTNVAIPNFA